MKNRIDLDIKKIEMDMSIEHIIYPSLFYFKDFVFLT